jgi:hypothetical protein
LRRPHRFQAAYSVVCRNRSTRGDTIEMKAVGSSRWHDEANVQIKFRASLLRNWTTCLLRSLNLITDGTNSRILYNILRPADFTVRRTAQYVVRRKLHFPGWPDQPLSATRACQAYLFRLLAHS